MAQADENDTDLNVTTAPPLTANSISDVRSKASSHELQPDPRSLSYPGDEGDKRAIISCIGSFFALFVAFGMLNVSGWFQAQWETNFLKQYSPSTIAWIPGVQFFLTLITSVLWGRLFDMYGGKVLLRTGSILYVFSMMMLSLSSEYYQFFFTYGIIPGFAGSMIFVPAVAIISQWYLKHRGLAQGLCFSAGCLAGIVLPIMLTQLFNKLGYGWAVRIKGFTDIFCLVIANLTIRSRLPPSKHVPGKFINLTYLTELRFVLMGLSIFFCDWNLFLPLNYLAAYGQYRGMTPEFSFYLLSILNAGSVLGRILPGLVSDRIGPFNVMMTISLLSGIFALGLWLPTSSVAATVVYAVSFGFTSGSYISLIPVVVGRISNIEEFGSRYGMALIFAGLASLTGVSIGGKLIEDADGGFIGVQLWTGVTSLVAFVLWLLTRITVGGTKVWKYV